MPTITSSNAFLENSSNPLFLAKNSAEIQEALTNGAYPNAVDPDGKTILEVLADRLYIDSFTGVPSTYIVDMQKSFELLLEQGALPNFAALQPLAETSIGTPVLKTVFNEYPEAILVKSSPNGMNLAQTAAISGNLEGLDLCLSRGSDPNVVTADGKSLEDLIGIARTSLKDQMLARVETAREAWDEGAYTYFNKLSQKMDPAVLDRWLKEEPTPPDARTLRAFAMTGTEITSDMIYKACAYFDETTVKTLFQLWAGTEPENKLPEFQFDKALRRAVITNNDRTAPQIVKVLIDALASTAPDKLQSVLVTPYGQYGTGINGYKEQIDERDSSMYGLTPAMRVTLQGHPKAAVALMEHISRERLDDQNPRSLKTVAHYAAGKGAADVLEFLQENYANLLMRDKNGRTPLFDLAKSVFAESSETIHVGSIKDEDMQRCIAAIYARTGTANDRDNFGKTPVIAAAEQHNVQFLKAVLPFKPDLSICDIAGRNAMEAALDERCKEFAQILIDAKAPLPVQMTGMLERTLDLLPNVTELENGTSIQGSLANITVRPESEQSKVWIYANDGKLYHRDVTHQEALEAESLKEQYGNFYVHVRAIPNATDITKLPDHVAERAVRKTQTLPSIVNVLNELKDIAKSPRNTQREAVNSVIAKQPHDVCKALLQEQNISALIQDCGAFVASLVNTSAKCRIASLNNPAHSNTEERETEQRSSQSVSRSRPAAAEIV